MKNDFNSQFFDDKDFFSNATEGNQVNELAQENEVGVAVYEQPQAAAGSKDNLFGEHDDGDDDFLFSTKKDDDLEEDADEDEDEADREQKIAESDEEKSNLAFAESSKDRLIDKIKGNLIYVFIALILIVPGVFKLYGVFFAGEGKPTQAAQNLTFAENNAKSTNAPSTAPSVAALTAPSSVEKNTTGETQVTEPKAENAIRSALQKVLPIGGGSKESSGTMPINEEKMKEENKEPAAKVETTGVAASILSSNKETGGTQILDRYFAQESKVEDQLAELLGKMDDIEARLATVDDLNKRLTALESNSKGNSTEQVTQQLQQLVTRIGQLEQNMHQMRQQAKKAPPVVANAPAAGAMNQPGANGGTAGISVEAVIPGRAWVRSRDGILMVVEVGDEIPGVGKVTRIDAREGIVATTTQIFKQ